jgi:hypothetical protein
MYDYRLMDAVEEDLNRRMQWLQEEMESVEDQLHAIADAKQAASTALDRVRQVAVGLILSPEDIGTRSQREILRLLAERNGGWLIVSQAIRAMTTAGIYSSDTNASAQVYTLLNPKQSEFGQIVPGVYRLNAEHAEAKTEQINEQQTSGLVERVGAVRAKYPDWPQQKITEALIRDGWDFHGKRPSSSVSMAYANLMKQERQRARGRPPRIAEAEHTDVLVNGLRGAS